MNQIKDRMRKWIRELELTTQEKRRILWIAICTLTLSLVLQIWDNQSFSGILRRNTYGDGDRIESLEMDSEEVGRTEIEVRVLEERYTEEELEEVFASSLVELETLVLGINESADMVDDALYFVEEIENTGIQVTWTWEPYEVLNLEGEIQEEHVEETGTLVELQATLSYQEEVVYFLQNICVYPKVQDEESRFLASVEAEIANIQEENITDSEFLLPMSVDGVEIRWYQKTSYRGIYILGMGCLMIVLLLYKKKDDKKQIVEKRKAEMLRYYSSVIHTFALYLGAGMTAKNAWKRMVIEQDGDAYIFEEMRKTYYEMSNGMSEEVCYELFAKRCDLRCYQRFGLLLSQNVRKGTKGLTSLLEREAFEAFEERKIRAREEGEKAGTKLLIPMFGMLIVVLLIMIVPAFISIQ